MVEVACVVCHGASDTATSFVHVPCGNSRVPWELRAILPKKFLTGEVRDAYSEVSLV